MFNSAHHDDHSHDLSFYVQYFDEDGPGGWGEGL